ncbi:DUF6907 domain-containing protein [Streptomyces albidoflavus]|uniref:DUF6907 domain-containing protein n=1 Tax=Streptomyces albidoflavus TaxID=1886 RepID=UPI0033C76D22
MAGTDTLSRLVTAARDGQPLLPRAAALGLELVAVSITDPDFYGVLIERNDGLAFGTPDRPHDWLTEEALRGAIEKLAGLHLHPAAATADDVLGTHDRAPWCQDDHTRDEHDGIFRADVTHIRRYEGTSVPVFWPGKDGGVEDTTILTPQLDVMPFSDTPARREPVVTVTLIEDHPVEDMGPDELEAFIATIRDQCDRLDQVHADLVAARAKWNEAQA